NKNENFHFQKGKVFYKIQPSNENYHSFLEKKEGKKKWSIKPLLDSSVNLIEVRKSKTGILYFYIADINMPVELSFTYKTENILKFLLGVPTGLGIILYLMINRIGDIEIQTTHDMFLMNKDILLANRHKKNFYPDVPREWDERTQALFKVKLEQVVGVGETRKRGYGLFFVVRINFSDSIWCILFNKDEYEMYKKKSKNDSYYEYMGNSSV
ncbi:MAG: hypothetical protein GY828_00345, partial [Candidatus Gracilibacteria bacterium]|nr:hypothetical protein [Candidatus Gracilibacteria bacterium]